MDQGGLRERAEGKVPSRKQRQKDTDPEKMQAQQQTKEKRSAGFLQLQRQPCSQVPSGRVSEGAGELGVLGA